MTPKQARRFLRRNRWKLHPDNNPRPALVKRADMATKILRRRKRNEKTL